MTPDISVRIITYNQVRFIRQTLESVLAQQTDYSYEIVIGDDCSTDGTSEIIDEYARRLPDVIRVLRPERNLGANLNDIRTRAACRGRYIAWLDGDDYWTDPHKLQKQVSFLESHPDFILAFHNALVRDEASGKQWLFNGDLPEEVTGKEVLEEWLVSNSSLVYRNPHRPDPDFFYGSTLTDLGVIMLLSDMGRLRYFPEVMSVYRLHPRSLSSVGFRGIRHNKKSVRLFRELDTALGFKYHAIFRRRIAQYTLSTGVLYAYEGHRALTLRYLCRALKADPRIAVSEPRYILIASLGVLSPGLLGALRRLKRRLAGKEGAAPGHPSH
ncbi:MAG: glycosyltransferase family 2 protein [Gemmatimonadota bacterium]